jgi:hypothetical protein
MIAAAGTGMILSESGAMAGGGGGAWTWLRILLISVGTDLGIPSKNRFSWGETALLQSRRRLLLPMWLDQVHPRAAALLLCAEYADNGRPTRHYALQYMYRSPVGI